MLRSDFVQQHAVECAFQTSDSWVILSQIEQDIKHKIDTLGTPLKDWGISIYRGVLTGLNNAFIISTSKRDEILADCTTEHERMRTAALIRPILRGRDITRYGYTWCNMWLIATFPSRHYNIEEYPSVKKYLLSIGKERLEQTGAVHRIHGESIHARKKTNNQWYETQDSISYWEEFSKPKIVWAETMRRHKNVNYRFPRFSFDDKGYLLDKTCFMGIGDEAEYIMLFLNSKIGEYLCGKYVCVLDNGGYLMQKVYLNSIPIPKFTKEQRTHIIDMYRKSFNENVLDEMFYAAYDFSEEEIRFIIEHAAPI